MWQSQPRQRSLRKSLSMLRSPVFAPDASAEASVLASDVEPLTGAFASVFDMVAAGSARPPVETELSTRFGVPGDLRP